MPCTVLCSLCLSLACYHMSAFYRERNQGSEMLSNLHKITQLIRIRFRVRAIPDLEVNELQLCARWGSDGGLHSPLSPFPPSFLFSSPPLCSSVSFLASSSLRSDCGSVALWRAHRPAPGPAGDQPWAGSVCTCELPAHPVGLCESCVVPLCTCCVWVSI